LQTADGAGVSRQRLRSCVRVRRRRVPASLKYWPCGPAARCVRHTAGPEPGCCHYCFLAHTPKTWRWRQPGSGNSVRRVAEVSLLDTCLRHNL
jgi:hypothetical protein